jgi:hypothetical protein
VTDGFRIAGLVGQIMARRYGALFKVHEFTATLIGGPLSVFPSNPDRLSMLIMNIGSGQIFTSPLEATLQALAGILLRPNGGGVAFNVDEDGVMPTLPWFVSAGGGFSAVYALELVRDVDVPSEITG